MYRLARHYQPPLARRASWQWYLLQAARTATAMWAFGGKGTGTSQWGLMVGSAFQRVLVDLEREIAAAAQAAQAGGECASAVASALPSAVPPRPEQSASRGRALCNEAVNVSALGQARDEMLLLRDARMRRWLAMEFPYGSEFPWDSTGHEEIHTWLLHDRKYAAANQTVGAVLAYMTLLPHWAPSGSARRYWDYVINGKTSIGNEREFHHYGSTLNAVALLDAYRAYPGRSHLLRLGTAALLGHLSNIYPSGAASMAWHGDPALLRRDGYSGDYGVGLYGYWRSAAAYLDCEAHRGWECMLCDIVRPAPTSSRGATACSQRVVIVPRDALHRRAYVAPIGLTLSVEGAQIVELEYHPTHRSVIVSLEPHEAARSAEATLFHTVERVFPPPLPGVEWHAECVDTLRAAGCSRKWQRDAHVIKLDTGITTRVRVEPRAPLSS